MILKACLEILWHLAPKHFPFLKISIWT